jgi:hypothetical protein
MRRGLALCLAAVLLAALPLTSLAQEAKEPAKPAGPTITPYGFLLAVAYWNSGTYSAYDSPVQAGATGVGNFVMSARQSRFGFKIGLPEDGWTGAKVTGLLEADFLAAYANAAPTTWNSAPLRLRQAWMQATWKLPSGSVFVLGGQAYSVIAPLFATTLAYAGNAIFQQAGNLWRRTPQFQVGYDGIYDDFGANLVIAVASPADATPGVTAPTSTATAVDNGVGNQARFPDLETRLGLVYRTNKTKLAELGISGHYNKRRYTNANNTFTDVPIGVAALDLEVNAPYVGLKAEAFSSKGGDDSFNGMLGAANVVTVTPATAGAPAYLAAVLTQGFWGQLVLKPIEEVNFFIGYGVEQAKIDDLRGATQTGGTAVPNSTRTHNIITHAGIIVNASKAWKFSVEGVQTISETYGAYKQAANTTPGQAQVLTVSSMLFF